MPEREPDGPGELPFDLLDRPVGLPGVGAFVVAVLDDQGAGGRAANMIDVLVQRRQGQLVVVRRCVGSHRAPLVPAGGSGWPGRVSSRRAGG
jgi:hypothetical protein